MADVVTQWQLSERLRVTAKPDVVIAVEDDTGEQSLDPSGHLRLRILTKDRRVPRRRARVGR